jgi:alpha,alpha-trehalose phosphorylase
MIEHPSFSGAAWTVRQTGAALDVLAQSESVFALSNGHIGLRGNLDEGEPVGLPGTYLNGFCERRTRPYAEAGFGYPDVGQTIVNVTDGKILRVLVDDEPLDLRYGTVEHHRRTLDLRAGLVTRDLVWCSPAGVRVRLQSARLVSFEHRAVAAIDLRVTALEQPARIVVQSELLANQPLPTQAKDPFETRAEDPRTAAELGGGLVAEHQAHADLRAMLAHRTRVSKLLMVAFMDHEVHAPNQPLTSAHVADDIARLVISTELAAGEQLEVCKYLAYGWSSQRALPALSGQTEAALVAARHAGWDQLVAFQPPLPGPVLGGCRR